MLIFTPIYVYVNEMRLMKGHKVGQVARREVANNPVRQEPMSRSMQLRYILVTAFS